jgi:murein L,D-transpeptidase YcbB/YkuD
MQIGVINKKSQTFEQDDDILSNIGTWGSGVGAMARNMKAIGFGGSLLLSSAGALAQQPVPAPAPVVAPSFSIPPDVAAAYSTYHIGQIWFRNGPDSPVIGQLTAVLQRAPFDGFAEGPQLAAQVQAAVAQVRSTPVSARAADQFLSAAWTRYVQALKRPTDGMIYAYPILRPHGTRTEEILLTAAAAPSLATYVSATSNLNPVYQELRDTAWAEAQASGNLAPDPRLLANLDRARSIPARGRFVLVDSGNQQLTMFEDGRPADSMRIIVGTNELPTPLIASMMYYITYNPYWHAPDHLVRKTIAPTYLRQGAKYLKSHGYHVIDEWSPTAKDIDAATVDWKGAAAGTTHLLIRQDPGPLNSMGNLKFPFDNPEGIYLHDTPSKDLFGRQARNLSNGCVRVEDARRFGRWLLGGQDPVAPGSDPETAVKLPQAVPIILTYLTAHVIDGKVSYANDFYGWDKAGAPQVAQAN